RGGVAERLRGARALTDVERLALGEGRRELGQHVLLSRTARLAQELVADVVDAGQRVHGGRVAVVCEVQVLLRLAEGHDGGAGPDGRSERDVHREGGDAVDDRADAPVDVLDLGRDDEVVHDRVRDDPATRRV